MLRALLRWMSLAVFVGILALMGQARLHLAHFNRFFQILLALAVFTTIIFVWTAKEPRPDGN
jgi:hypothetical protein